LSRADARANLGFVYLTQQRMPEAKIELERAVAENPSSAKAQDVLAKLEKVENAVEPKSLGPLTASSPVAQPPISRQFNLGPSLEAEMRPYAAIASKPADELSVERWTNMNDLPTQKLSPVLSNYPLLDTVPKPAPAVDLTEFADRPPVTSTVIGTDKPSHSGEAVIRILPPPAGPPPGG
jgi:hypothetical protein